MIDFKFHIFSLVAIFLALGIGIVVGITLVGDDSLVQEQKVIIDRLEKDFKMLRDESRETQKEIAAFKSSNNIYQEFAQTVLPALVKGRLARKNIAIINTNHYASTDNLENNLRLAGANVVSLTKVNTNFDFTSEKMRSLLATNLGITPKKNVNEFIAAIAEYVGQGILFGFQPEKLTFLKEMNLIQFTGSTWNTLDCVVILGGRHVRNDNLVKLIDLSLISLFLENGVNVAATEQSGVPYSSMTLYQTKDIITVDNIETPIGQIALIYALEGIPGHYGIKSTANNILPDLNEIPVGSGF